MPYNSVAQALADFSNILGEEQVRLDKEEAVQRQKISATRIADAFTRISPMSDEEDARRVMLDTIADASMLETLDTSLPLIQGLYNDSTNAIRNYKAKKQDELLKTYTSGHGYDGPGGLEGNTQLKIMEYEHSREEKVTQTDAEGRTRLNIYDAHGEISRTFSMDERTDASRFDFELRKISAQERVRAQFRDRADYVTYAGTTPEGLPISFNKQENMFYVPYTDENGNAGMRPYDGTVIRGSKSSIDQAKTKQSMLATGQKRIWMDTEGIAQDVLSRLNIDLPLDATYMKVGTSNFNKLGKMTANERVQAMKDAGILNEDGTINPDRQEDYKAVSGGILDFEAQYDKYKGYGEELNATTDIVSYEEGLDYAGTSSKEWNKFYMDAKNYVSSDSAEDIETRKWIRDNIARWRGISESDAQGMDAVAWDKEWSALSNLDKSKVIKKLKQADQ